MNNLFVEKCVYVVYENCKWLVWIVDMFILTSIWCELACVHSIPITFTTGSNLLSNPINSNPYHLFTAKTKIISPWCQANPYPDRLVLRSTRTPDVKSYALWSIQLVTSHLGTSWLMLFKGKDQLVPYLWVNFT